MGRKSTKKKSAGRGKRKKKGVSGDEQPSSDTGHPTSEADVPRSKGQHLSAKLTGGPADVENVVSCDGCGEWGPCPELCTRCGLSAYCGRPCHDEAEKRHGALCEFIEKKAAAERKKGQEKAKWRERKHLSTGKKCDLCHEDAADAVSFPDCDHTFCRGCLVRYQGTATRHGRSNACPPCPRERRRSELKIDTAVCLLSVARKYDKGSGKMKQTDMQWHVYWSIYALEETKDVLQYNSSPEVASAHALVQIEALCIAERWDGACAKYGEFIEEQGARVQCWKDNAGLREMYRSDLVQGAREFGTFEEIGMLEKRLGMLKMTDPTIMLEFFRRAAEIMSIYCPKGDKNSIETVSEIFKFSSESTESYNADNESAEVKHDVGTVLANQTSWLYEVGRYADAITAGKKAIRTARYIPGVHIRVARSQKKLGDLVSAKTTIGKSLLYEGKWDKESQVLNQKFWDEIHTQG